MTSWHNLSFERHVFQPEIRVGLHDFWLSQISFGPTQAERVLEQSPMLEQAHERRFAHSQLKTDTRGFQNRHMERVRDFLNALCSVFDHESARDDNVYTFVGDIDLAGLTLPAQGPGSISTEELPPDQLEIGTKINKPCEQLDHGVPAAAAFHSSLHDTAEVESPDEFDIAGFPHPSQIPRAHQRYTENSVRQRKAVRVRREPKPCSAQTPGSKIRSRRDLTQLREKEGEKSPRETCSGANVNKVPISWCSREHLKEFEMKDVNTGVT